MFWVVANTKVQREAWAAENVERQGFDCYLPKIAPSSSSAAKKPQCLFPRYLFVKTDGRWRFLLGTYGLLGVVMGSKGPAVLPDTVLNALKAREGEDGLITLPKAPTFRPNGKVRVTDGTFSGCLGIYETHDGETRARILLDLLGRKVRVLIDENTLEAVNG